MQVGQSGMVLVKISIKLKPITNDIDEFFLKVCNFFFLGKTLKVHN